MGTGVGETVSDRLGRWPLEKDGILELVPVPVAVAVAVPMTEGAVESWPLLTPVDWVTVRWRSIRGRMAGTFRRRLGSWSWYWYWYWY